MPTYVALLRGINVSGHNQIKMPALKALFDALGHSAVTTYIQSGNVVFTSPLDQPAEIAGAIEARISADFGMNVPVILRTGEEMAAIAANNPFPPPPVYVTFLADLPDTTVVEVQGAEPDEFAVRGREIYLHCPGGYGNTKLNNALWERRLRMAATTRNWKTVTKMADLAGGTVS